MKRFTFPKSVHFAKPVRSIIQTRRVSQQKTGWNLHDEIPLEKKPIINKNTILRDVDKVLGRKPPSIEVLYVNPPWKKALSFWTTSLNPYGHSAIRYTLPSGEQVVMNIVGLQGAEMVNFMTPEEYLFGLPEETEKIGSEQGGVYRRSIVGARIESVPDEQVLKLHNFYKELKKRSTMLSEDAMFQDAGFSLMFGPIINFIRRWKIGRLLFGQVAEKGNCAYWTARGLSECGILQRPAMYPKMVLLKVVAQYVFQNRQNFNIVFYPSISKLLPRDGGWLGWFPWSLEHIIFENLHTFADAKVSVKKAVVTNGTIVYEDKKGNQITWQDSSEPMKEPENTPCYVGITKLRTKGFKAWFNKNMTQQ